MSMITEQYFEIRTRSFDWCPVLVNHVFQDCRRVFRNSHVNPDFQDYRNSILIFTRSVFNNFLFQWILNSKIIGTAARSSHAHFWSKGGPNSPPDICPPEQSNQGAPRTPTKPPQTDKAAIGVPCRVPRVLVGPFMEVIYLQGTYGYPAAAWWKTLS